MDYFKEYEMNCCKQLDLRSRPVGTRFLYKPKNNVGILESHIVEWSESKKMVKLADLFWHDPDDITVVDFLTRLHVEEIKAVEYAPRPSGYPWDSFGNLLRLQPQIGIVTKDALTYNKASL